MPCPPRPPRAAAPDRRAFTLLEVLAVIAIVGAAAAVAMLSLARATDAARVRTGAALVQDLDARARVLARQGRPCSLRLDADALVIAIEPIAGRAPRLIRAPTPPGITVAFSDTDANPLRAVAIDARGRSPDYRAVVRGNGATSTVSIAGLTGWRARHAAGARP